MRKFGAGEHPPLVLQKKNTFSRVTKMQELEKKLEYEFKDKSLLVNALTHSSYANENRKSGAESNERLEFLGDSILGMVVAEFLYKRYGDMPEGRMTRFRAELVCERSLHAVAEEINLGAYISLGRGEEQGGGRTRPSILADAVEAVLAAVYLDGGFDAAKRIIDRFILTNALDGEYDSADYKTRLQEYLQRGGAQDITYAMVSERGPDHMKTFTAQVALNGEPLGTGEGHSKKSAEQAAARSALEALGV